MEQTRRGLITFGVAVSLSGRYALLGRQVLHGLECYVRDVNTSGGIRIDAEDRRVPVTLLVEDDEGDATRVRNLVEKLIVDDGVDLLIGPYGSGLTLAAAEVAEATRCVLWNHSGSADQIFERDFRWTVGIISPASRYLCAVLEALRALDGDARRVAVFSTETGFAADVANGALAWIRREGFTLTTHRTYPSGKEDFRGLVERLKDDPPDWLLGVGRVEDDLRLGCYLRELRPRLKAAGLVVAAIDQFKAELGDGAEGFLAPSQWEPGARYAVDCGPSGTEFLASYGRSVAAPIDYPAAQGYAAGVIAQRCVEETGSLDQRMLRDAASRLRCTTFYGPYAIEAETGRQTAHPMLVIQWRGGSKKIVWPQDVAGAAPVYPGPFWR